MLRSVRNCLILSDILYVEREPDSKAFTAASNKDNKQVRQ